MRKVLAFAVLALLLVSPAMLGQAQRGIIEVTVTDADGARLPGAAVEVSSDETLTRRSVVTGADGTARIVSLDPATNYQATISMDGFATQTVSDIAVRAGQTQAVEAQLGLSEISEELVVVAEAPLVDVSSTQAGQDITLELTESLPTTRGYQGYLQLVPGVQDALGTTENPASRSGINYRDVDGAEGDAGRSTDNLYYFDGINVTDRTAGTAGANINSEVIQEQSVLTGAIPAEFVGVPGLVSNVVTKSGGNEFSGSVNYYFQNDSLVADNDHFKDETFSIDDYAITLGGPIVRDRAWFFASYRVIDETRDVIDEQDNFLRSPSIESDQTFVKGTWAITDSSVLSGQFLADPRDQTGSFDRSVPNSADSVFERGGDRYSISYNQVWGSTAAELAFTDHEADLNQTPIDQSNRNAVSFAPGEVFTSAEELLGGLGTNFVEFRATESARASLEYLFDTSWGDHAVKFGIVDGESTLFENDETAGDPPATYLSLNPRGTGGNIVLCEIVGTCGSGDPWSTVDFGVSSDEVNGFNEGLTAAQRQTLIDLGWDQNGNGIFDQTEIQDNMTFGSTAGNPNGLINYTRDLQTQAGPSNKGSESTHFYLQDSWQWNKWSVNAGLRVEDTTFIADNGDDVGTFDVETAPRISISYDIGGDGRSSVGVFYGEYYDAFRDTSIDFAGSLTGRVIEEQVYVDALGDWVNFRFRGGTAVQDAFFAPRIETPVTEEIQIQYKRDLGRNMMFEINLIDRETTGIGEDYGSFYYNIDQYIALGGDPNDPNSFFLGPQFFGFNSLSEIPTNLNFLIGSLPGAAFRDWQGLELIFRKRFSDNWQMLASFNYADADGNSNSDANFDGAGDVIFLDPRAPNRTGTQPGLVETLFKVHSSYSWDNGFQVGGSYRWNDGIILNRNQGQAFARSLPDRVTEDFAFGGWPGGGFEDTWIANDALGFIDGNGYGILDLRGSYLWNATDNMEVDFFLDIFNVLDEQDVIKVQDLVGGGQGFSYLDGIEFVQPRRFFLGARLRF